MNICHQSLKLLLAIVSILSCLDWEEVSIAAPLLSTINSNSVKAIEGDRVIFNPPEKQESRDRPRGTVPGQTRRCKPNSKDLVALVPATETDPDKNLLWGLTTKEHPTFWAYIPDSSESIISSKFSLRKWNSENNSQTTVYESELILTNTPGIISVTLPITAPPLEINQWYHFYFFINLECPENGMKQKVAVEGLIKRKQPNTGLKTQLQTATLLQQAILYGKNSFWFDMLNTLAKIKETEPKNQQWSEVLSSTGLKEIASEPIVDCCKPKN